MESQNLALNSPIDSRRAWYLHFDWNSSSVISRAMILFVITMLIRLPYFVPSVIFWHESTYILLGQDIIDGHLPQTFISELKPPAAGIPYALFILLFGKSVQSIRFGGVVCVWLASVLINKACRNRFDNTGAFLAAIMLIIFATIDERAGCTMLEHVALVPLSCLVVLLSGGKINFRTSFVSGLTISIAALLKTNLIFFALAPFVITLCRLKRSGYRDFLYQNCALAAGLICPQIFVFAIYALSNNLDLLIHSCIVAPTVSAAYQRDQLTQKLPEVWSQIKSANPFAVLFCWVLPIVALIKSRCLMKSEREQSRDFEFLFALALCILAGIMTMIIPGVIHARRYFIALVPFTSVMAAYPIKSLLSNGRAWKIIFAVGFMSVLLPVVQAYKNAWMILSGRETDVPVEISNYLANRQVKNQYVYFQTAHIGYWLTGARVPTRFIHPTDMSKPGILSTLYKVPYTPQSALSEILEKHPDFIVAPIRTSESAESDFTRALDEELKTNYKIVKTFDKVAIFEPINSSKR